MGPSSRRYLLRMTRVLGYRFPNKAHFASWNGTAPIHASSGDVPREADATGPLTIGAEVDGLARGLLTGQLDDGGWNCETENGATSWPGERCLLENTHPGETPLRVRGRRRAPEPLEHAEGGARPRLVGRPTLTRSPLTGATVT